MRLKAEQLNAALKKSLAPIYFITGDEPLQLGEAVDAVRASAKKAGYDAREVFTVETGFNWAELALQSDSFSIFSDKKIIELRIPSGKTGTEGSKALMAYCQRLPEDTLLLITAGKLAKSSLTSKWFQALDQAGVVVQVWPLDGQDLIHWLQRRMQTRGLQADLDSIKIIASQIEGNLLAAAQEIEKLYVLYGEGRLNSQQILEVLTDSSRFDVFKLIDAILAAKPKRIIKILQGLKDEGVAAPIVLWALTREIRTLLNIKYALGQGQNKAQVFKNNQIWDKRKNLVDSALNRLKQQELEQALLLSAHADRQIKGAQKGDAWETLLGICMTMASLSRLAYRL